MKYFFVLGTNPALSLAELLAVVKFDSYLLACSDLLIVSSETEINPVALIKRLGGIIKIGVIKYELKSGSKHEDLLLKTSELAIAKQKSAGEGKFNFGFSDYGQKYFNKKDLGLKLKKYFSEHKISSRFVVSQEKNLSSVVVEQNKLLKRGVEIILTESGGVTFIGETLAVQPFKDLSRRDYGRPARDDQSGMIPPKLAQVLINLAQITKNDDLIVDPFCGSGTILSESILLGYKNIFGSDISIVAVENTKKNISWTKELYGLKDIKMKFLVKNVVDVSKFIKSESVDAIITEPYLGPQRGRIEFEAVIKDLEVLYTKALQEFYKILKSRGRIAMVWPVFYGDRPIYPNIDNFKVLSALPTELMQNQFVKNFLSERNTIIYGRSGQKVFREIILLEKI